MKDKKPKKSPVLLLALLVLLILTISIMAIYCITTHGKTPANQPNQASGSEERIEELFSVKTIPKVYITSEKKNIDRYEYSPATIQITDEENSANTTATLSGNIRARGNSTYELGLLLGGAIPYKLKLDEKQNLLGMGEHKKWNLIANFYDRSYVKQFIAYATASAIYGENRYQPEAKFAEVYLDEEYRGLYLLTESIEEDDGALDIEVDTRNYGDKIPFLVEMEYFKMPNLYIKTGDLSDYFATNYFYANAEIENPYWLTDDNPNNDELMFPQPYVLKYPKSFQNISATQANNIKSTMRSLYSSVKNNARLNEINIDADSFIDSWVFCEIFASPTCYYGPSAYIYRAPNSSKLTAGPLWDFDMTLPRGRINGFFGENDPEEAYQNNVLVAGLLANQDFQRLLTSRYEEIYNNILPQIKNKIIELKTNQTLKDAVQKAEEKYDTWHMSLESVPEGEPRPDEAILSIDTFEGHVDYILGYLFNSIDNQELGRTEWIYQNLESWKLPKI